MSRINKVVVGIFEKEPMQASGLERHCPDESAKRRSHNIKGIDTVSGIKNTILITNLAHNYVSSKFVHREYTLQSLTLRKNKEAKKYISSIQCYNTKTLNKIRARHYQHLSLWNLLSQNKGFSSFKITSGLNSLQLN